MEAIKKLSIGLACLVPIYFISQYLQYRDPPVPSDIHISVERSAGNPLIAPASSPRIRNNINGPSVIRVPEWLPSPLGKYYMYFAHHEGKYIRLAYADTLDGPWKIHEKGTLRLSQAEAFSKHIASPDVHVDNANRVIRMYFHGPARGSRQQKTGVATSNDGLSFHPSDSILEGSYLRVFRLGDSYYGVSVGGSLHRSSHPGKHWRVLDNPIVSPVTVKDAHGIRTNVRMRHPAVFVKDRVLYLFYSRTEDAPERILLSTVVLTDDWNQWTASKPIEVIRHTEAYEGIDYPVKPSRRGRGTHVHELRDPYILEEDGSLSVSVL